MVSKIGRSTIAHRETCPQLNKRRMRTWLEAGEESRIRRVPCPVCSPAVGDQMDPQTWLECSRFTVLQARDVEALSKVLLQGRPGEPPQTAERLTGLVRQIVRQLRASDTAFQQWWMKFITASDD